MAEKMVIMLDNAILATENKGNLIHLIKDTLKEVWNDAYLLIIDIDFISIKQISEIKAPIMFLTSQYETEPNQISTLQVTYDFLYQPVNKEQFEQEDGLFLSPYNNNS